MNGALGLISFGLGACLATVVLRGLGEGAVPDVRQAAKRGIRAWKTIADAAGAAQAEFDAFQAEVRAQSHVPQAAASRRRRIALEPPA
jgi:hypothetical protein